MLPPPRGSSQQLLQPRWQRLHEQWPTCQSADRVRRLPAPRR
jgi:hypothetical protein